VHSSLMFLVPGRAPYVFVKCQSNFVIRDCSPTTEEKAETSVISLGILCVGWVFRSAHIGLICLIFIP